MNPRALPIALLLSILLWLLLALSVLAATGNAATAKTIYCPGFECYGTNQPEQMIGAQRMDFLFANAGGDLVRGRRGDDMLDSGRGPDQVVGGPGEDEIWAGSGDDWVNIQDGQRDIVHCGTGHDFVQIDLNLDEVHSCEFQGGIA